MPCVACVLPAAGTKSPAGWSRQVHLSQPNQGSQPRPMLQNIALTRDRSVRSVGLRRLPIVGLSAASLSVTLRGQAMGRPPIDETPMTPAERQRRARYVTKQAAMAPALPLLTAAERQTLLVVMRQREKVAMGDAIEYEATLIANFERKLATVYKPSDHPVWVKAHAIAKIAAPDRLSRLHAALTDGRDLLDHDAEDLESEPEFT